MFPSTNKAQIYDRLSQLQNSPTTALHTRREKIHAQQRKSFIVASESREKLKFSMKYLQLRADVSCEKPIFASFPDRKKKHTQKVEEIFWNINVYIQERLVFCIQNNEK